MADEKSLMRISHLPLRNKSLRNEVYMGNYDNLSENDKLKYEIAEELGLLDKVKELGWKGLSAKESGKIGGMIVARKKKSEKNMRKYN